nr:MAG TPA: hypothetical protein [Caudoviricetes sp.]DAZ12525.1 MAG TPA: hypothetical protein [Caudoviricetes sp.]
MPNLRRTKNGKTQEMSILRCGTTDCKSASST